ncbi:AtpZ/AtpI family protein [Novipirellula artificiosorum]|uniref:F0F1-ATPase subunit n=1 Tax=Novipirellula artificiosorum TaxID=2528016 RepID=A0A5C6DQ35_9BACT|nr:AtpZ/AtpI family protein [Novipirellula artificiosorum]TWU38345.1 hypothetical protein Poly41_28210 [Novipirellula artificiosorum]
MNTQDSKRSNLKADLQREVDTKQTRKMAARSEGERSAWFGLGMFGLVGWSVTVPTLLGIMLGLWIDKQWPSRFSWTLMLLVMGVAVGCLNAWWWIKQET